MGAPFVGSEAIAAGTLTKYQLHKRHIRLFRNVYLARDTEVTATVKAKAAWLWTGRRGVIAGFSAAAMHGSKWVEAHLPGEVIHDNRFPQQGVKVWGDKLQDNEIQLMNHLPVTTLARTALDLGCWYERDSAVAAIDALANATNFPLPDAWSLLDRHRGRRGIEKARIAMDLVDAGSQSPKETWLRLLLIDAGFPRPQTQIPVDDETGDTFAYLDMGWEDIKIAVEYDGEQHRTNRTRYSWDVRRQERIQRQGWIVIRVLAGDSEADIIRRVRQAIAARA